MAQPDERNLVWWPPRWAMHARRSLTLPAGSLLMEMFMQGKEVSMAKASGGGRAVVWNHPLEDLRACAASSVFKAKNELLDRGFLVELPGARVGSNGRAFSGWMTPLEQPPEYTPISGRTAEYTPNSVSTWSVADSDEGPEYTPISGRTPEYTPNSVGTESGAPRVRARGLDHHHQRSTTTNNDFPKTEPCLEVSDSPVDPKRRGVPTLTHNPSPTAEGEGRRADQRFEIALGGLRWAKYRDPEQALARYGVERCLVAVQALARKYEANEFVAKPGGFVFSLLMELQFVEVAPVADVGFARWWDAASLPANVRVMR